MSRLRHFAYGAVLVIIFLTASPALAGDPIVKNPTVDWPELEKVWNQYLAYPSGENARKVIDALPSSGNVKYTNSADEDRVIELVYSNLNMVERQAYSGDREAIRLLFRLGPIVDGAFAEDRNLILGALVRIQPRLFLEEFKEFQALGPCSCYVQMGGPPFYSRESWVLETNLRIATLMKITDPKLKKVRDECVAALKEILKPDFNK